ARPPRHPDRHRKPEDRPGRPVRRGKSAGPRAVGEAPAPAGVLGERSTGPRLRRPRRGGSRHRLHDRRGGPSARCEGGVPAPGGHVPAGDVPGGGGQGRAAPGPGERVHRPADEPGGTTTAGSIRIPAIARWSEDTMKLSARNVLKGRVVKVTRGATTAHVKIDVNGTVVTASITNEAVDELSLREGDQAYAVVKASDVMVGKD